MDQPDAVPGSVRVSGLRSQPAAPVPVAVDWLVPEEVPVAVTVNGSTLAVMMATPADLEDFAVGFALAEGVLSDPAAVEDIAVQEDCNGLVVHLSVTPAAVQEEAIRGRTLAGRSGCGLCGVDSLDGAVRWPGQRVTPLTVTADAVQKALMALPDHQPQNRLNRSVHAAAWCAPDGTVVLAREDVGRHNALDKVIGAMARAGRDPAAGFVVMTSRCSFELVQKAATAGIPVLATLSAPTALALRLAEAAGLTVLAAHRDGGVVRFSGGPAGQDEQSGPAGMPTGRDGRG